MDWNQVLSVSRTIFTELFIVIFTALAFTIKNKLKGLDFEALMNQNKDQCGAGKAQTIQTIVTNAYAYAEAEGYAQGLSGAEKQALALQTAKASLVEYGLEACTTEEAILQNLQATWAMNNMDKINKKTEDV